MPGWDSQDDQLSGDVDWSNGTTPVPDGNYNLTFKIYGSLAGADSLWREYHLNVSVTNGLFNVILGSITTLNLAFNTDYWLGIRVGNDPELSPRIRLTSVGYAYRAQIADSAVTSSNISVPLSLSGSSGSSIISGTNSGSGNGVSGYTSNGSAGVYGNSYKTSGYGVWGRADSGSIAAGVVGSSTKGYGVNGTSTSGVGVSGYSDSSAGVSGYTPHGGYGVTGQSDGTNGTGVYGVANTGSAAWGVWGKSTSGYAGWFSGNVNVTGTLTKGGLAFKIDHPLDPENRYLCHSGVESPDMMNIYNGIVTLDANGEAKVELPDYFEALNKDFRYQLTCIGDFAPVYIAEKISNNQFKIAGGKANLEVSWQVTGIRHDPFAQAHRIQVEVEKTGEERGKYLHPKEYGVSETLGVDYEKTHEMEEKTKVMEQQQLEQEKIKAEYLKTQGEPDKK